MAGKMHGPGLKVFYTGPFFKNDPRKTFRRNAREFIEEAQKDAQRVAMSNLPPSRSGVFRNAVLGGNRMKSLGGKKWQLTGVMTARDVLAPWANRKFNYAGKVNKRYKTFSRARRQLYRIKGANKNLLRGIT